MFVISGPRGWTARPWSPAWVWYFLSTASLIFFLGGVLRFVNGPAFIAPHGLNPVLVTQFSTQLDHLCVVYTILGILEPIRQKRNDIQPEYLRVDVSTTTWAVGFILMFHLLLFLSAPRMNTDILGFAMWAMFQPVLRAYFIPLAMDFASTLCYLAHPDVGWTWEPQHEPPDDENWNWRRVPAIIFVFAWYDIFNPMGLAQAVGFFIYLYLRVRTGTNRMINALQGLPGPSEVTVTDMPVDQPNITWVYERF
ncbi:hypothetical protein QBC44DRAFT_357662 [Cladorrhinum sp. PSN332]|nr:hypothetical protein QBC44DRAFT_357662 [Cladorrhinum sp. PSN332]